MALKNMKCPGCGAKVFIDFDPKEKSRVVPCPGCFHDKWHTWIEDEKGNKVSEAVKLVDGRKVLIPGRVFKNSKEEHGKKLKLFIDGSVEVAQEHPCDCK